MQLPVVRYRGFRPDPPPASGAGDAAGLSAATSSAAVTAVADAASAAWRLQQRLEFFVFEERVKRVSAEHKSGGGAADVGVTVTAVAEKLPGEKKSHFIHEVSDEGHQDSRGPYTIPSGHMFFMGDNRDNSVDSRATNGPGMVPLDHLIGRADSMMFSFKRCDKEEGLRCPPTRFFKGL